MPAPTALAGGEGTRYAVAWDVKESTHEHEALLPTGEERTFRFRVEQPNVTRVRFEILWDESHENAPTGPDRFTLEAARPNGASLPPASGHSGHLVVDAPDVARVPEPVDVTARDEDALEAALAEHASDAGMGAWPLAVRLDDTGAPEDDPRADTGNRYTVRVTMWYYAPVVQRVVDLDSAPLASVGADTTLVRTVWAWATPVLAVIVIAQAAVLVAWHKRDNAA